jgi:hypothetical protein
MGGTYKPRHIRDIAHLYISGSKGGSCPPCATVLMAGEDKRCFSGFHAANLAAALSSKAVSVHLFERSGVLPNAGYFLSLPPRQYIPREPGEDASVAGVGGVMIDCSSKGFPVFADGADRPGIELVHLPPSIPEKPFRECVREVRGFLRPATIFVLLRIDSATSGEIPECVVKELGPAAVCVLRLDDADLCHHDDDPSTFDLGSLTDWKSALRDRVPAVIRDPDSALSRAYVSVGDRLLSRISQVRREAGAKHTVGTSTATRSR